uniref:Uncharacterized protein n=1 Tax=Anopheles arabiensis TaxID=7173 RepID=A0A182IHE7_ANOAR
GPAARTTRTTKKHTSERTQTKTLHHSDPIQRSSECTVVPSPSDPVPASSVQLQITASVIDVCAFACLSSESDLCRGECVSVCLCL